MAAAKGLRKSSLPALRKPAPARCSSPHDAQPTLKALSEENLRLHRKLAEFEAQLVSARNKIMVLQEWVAKLAKLSPDEVEGKTLSNAELNAIARQGLTPVKRGRGRGA